MLKYFLLWIPMLFIAVLNGTARDLGYKRFTGELAARQISTLSLIVLFGIYFAIILRKYPPLSGRHALLIGLVWLALTLVFEFGLGLARGNSWTPMLDDYNIFKGRIWILVLIWVAFGPYLIYKMRG